MLVVFALDAGTWQLTKLSTSLSSDGAPQAISGLDLGENLFSPFV